MPRSRSRARRRVDLGPRRTRGDRRSPSVRNRRRKRHRPRGAVSQEDASSSRSPLRLKPAKKNADSSKWICGTCGGPHRTRECPVTGGAAPGMGAMMGMMVQGMPPMAMPGMSPFPAMLGATQKPSGDAKSEDRSSGSGSSSSSSEDSPPARVRKRRQVKAKDEKPVGKVERPQLVRVEEVEKFMVDNKINEEAALKVRALSPASQRILISRQFTGDIQDPSKVMIARVRAQQQQKQQQNDAAKASTQATDMWAAWSNALTGAAPEAVEKFIKEKALDEGAAQQLRTLPPNQQAVALRWDLSGFKNPSAKFMSMAAGLGQPPKMGMPGLHSPMMGMPPVMGMMGCMPLGMPPVGMHPTMPRIPPRPGQAHVAAVLPQASKKKEAEAAGPSMDEL